MNFIDLTIDEEETNNQVETATLPVDEDIPANPPPKKEFMREEEQPKPEPKHVKDYEWIAVDESTQEIDYMKTFRDNHKNDKLDFEVLDIESLDPHYTQPKSFRVNVIDKIIKSIAKDGVIKTTKKAQDDYDVNDAFVDDVDDLNMKMATLNQLTPAFEDFICMSGTVEQFRKSNYFDKRLKVAKKFNNEAKKPAKKAGGKTGKKSGKEPKEKAPPKEKESGKEPKEKAPPKEKESGKEPKEKAPAKEKEPEKEKESIEEEKPTKEDKPPKEKKSKEEKPPKEKKAKKKRSEDSSARPASELKKVKKTTVEQAPAITTETPAT